MNGYDGYGYWDCVGLVSDWVGWLWRGGGEGGGRALGASLTEGRLSSCLSRRRSDSPGFPFVVLSLFLLLQVSVSWLRCLCRNAMQMHLLGALGWAVRGLFVHYHIIIITWKRCLEAINLFSIFHTPPSRDGMTDANGGFGLGDIPSPFSVCWLSVCPPREAGVVIELSPDPIGPPPIPLILHARMQMHPPVFVMSWYFD